MLFVKWELSKDGGNNCMIRKSIRKGKKYKLGKKYEELIRQETIGIKNLQVDYL